MATPETLYHAAAALVLFKPEGTTDKLYIEYYDMDENGSPVNPRPLTAREAKQLSKALSIDEVTEKAFLTPKGILPVNVLRINTAAKGNVIWYTKPRCRKLYFSESLGIASKEMDLPALVWWADRHRLHIYAFKGKTKPNSSTPLLHAPFFNIYHNGNVCMGSVSVKISKSASLEEFMAAWENYFFDSYFSHLIGGHNPIEGNLTTLYGQLSQGKGFPVSELLPNGLTLKDIFR